MSYFHIQPKAVQAQSSELDDAYRQMCQSFAELGGIIRNLETMSGLDDVLESLRRVRRTGSEQQASLRQCARVLEQVAALYLAAEEKNLNAGPERIERMPMFSRPNRIRPRTDAADGWQILQRLEMLPISEEWFGMLTIVDG